MIGTDGTNPTRLADFGTVFDNYYGYVDSNRYFAYHP